MNRSDCGVSGSCERSLLVVMLPFIYAASMIEDESKKLMIECMICGGSVVLVRNFDYD